MKQFNKIATFLKKNRTIIYVILGTILVLQVCSRNEVSDAERISANGIENVISEGADAINNMNSPEGSTSNGNDFNSLLLMVGLVLAFFVAKRFGYLEKLFPKIIIVKLSFAKQKASGNLVAQVVLINHKKDSINFQNPVLVFHKGKSKREFVIKNIGGVNYFPLTLPSGTGHKFNVDVQKFYNNVDGLTAFKNISVKFDTTSGKTFTSMRWPTWVVIKTLK